MTLDGTCLCGAVRYQLDRTLDPLTQCHCSLCRKHHGSAFATIVSGPLRDFRWLAGADAIATYRASAQGERPFCTTCGSVAPVLSEEAERVYCPAGNLQGELCARAQEHWFVGSKAPWHEITDAWPQHATFPPAFSELRELPHPAAAADTGVTRGSCVCGAVTYEVSGTPERMYNCHCSRCRRGRSAAYATNAAYALAGFRWNSGAEHVREYKLPEAERFTFAFCSQCGGAAPKVAEQRAIAIIPAGTLDDAQGAQPTAHIYVGSKAGWFEITDSLPRHTGPAPL